MAGEEGFTDVEIDDFELDESDLKQLERIELPDKLPNGNIRCNHPCKDKERSYFTLNNLLTEVGVGTSAAKRARLRVQRSANFPTRNQDKILKRPSR